jgi:riboflavin biosynthesis pyrimidine reductase
VVATVSGDDLPIKTNLLRFSPDNLLILASSEISAVRLSVLSNLAYVELVPEEKVAVGSQLNLIKALEILKKRYAVEMLLVEGGPSLNHALVASDLADELFLTLVPKLFGGAHHDSLTILEGTPLLLPKGPHPELKLISVLLSNDELFLRYTLQPL